MSDDPYEYFNQVVAARAMLLSEAEQLAGSTLLSLETTGDPLVGIYSYARDHFREFITLVRRLKPMDQELLLAYFCCEKSQSSLEKSVCCTQTILSQQIRTAVKAMLAYPLLATDGEIRPETMKTIFEKYGLEMPEEFLGKLTLSDCCNQFVSGRDFAALAKAYGIWRPDLRKTASKAAKTLLAATDDPKSVALGNWIFNTMIDRTSPSGRGYSKAQRKKLGDVALKDPAILGDFRVDAGSEDFDKLFTGRANF